MSLQSFLMRRATLAIAACCAVASASCSDPVPAAPQGAFTAEFGNAPGNACPATTPTTIVGIGSVTESEKATVADGDGATVTCKVVPIAGGLSAEASINNGSTAFTMSGVTFNNMTGTGRVLLRGPNTTGTYTPSTGSSCTFDLIQGDSGRIWTKFSCPTMEITGVPSSLCAVSGGIAVFENCLTE